MALTDLKLKNLKPKGKQYKISDFDGLYVLVKPNGSRLFRFKYYLDGKEYSVAFGKYSDVPLLRARQLRDEARQQVAAGINSREIKQNKIADVKAKNSNTFKKVAALYLEKITIEGRAPATLKKNAAFIAKANKDFWAPGN